MKKFLDISRNMKLGGEDMTGRKIKEYLRNKGISQIFVSNKTGIQISTLNSALNGNRKI